MGNYPAFFILVAFNDSMLYFNPKPDFKRLSKYYQFAEPSETLEFQYADGYPIVIDWYFTDEMVEEFEIKFKEIIEKHSLLQYHDDLLFLVLGKIQDVEAVVYELEFQFLQKKRTKELAGFLLSYLEAQPKQANTSVTLKTLTNTAKITDTRLIQWMFDSIVSKFEQGSMKAADFEFNIRERFFNDTPSGKALSTDKLRIEANSTIISPSRSIKSLQADFCLYMYKYLREETNIIPNQNTLMSDALLYFYFDILELVNYINPDTIESEPKDYVSALLRNRLKNINP